MSDASMRVATRAAPGTERFKPWIAALGSALLHLLLMLVAMLSPTPVVTPPQGASSGSWVEVDFIGETQESDPIPPVPPSATPVASTPTPRRTLVQAVPVPDGDEPIPADATDPVPAPQARLPAQRPSVPTTAQRQPRQPAANPTATTQRRPEQWGQPPGMVMQELAPSNAGPSHGPMENRGYMRDPTIAEPSMEVGGYHVYYDLSSEPRLRMWREQGMTEISIPLPGIRQYMVCPLETALRRESGECRLLDPSDPQMESIGDARKVISVQQVHRRGQLLWRGPGPYR